MFAVKDDLVCIPAIWYDVNVVAVNFYSIGDEVLELYANNSLMIGTGVVEGDWFDPVFAHHCWHKQELFKGRAGLTAGLGGTSWAGWRFNNVLLLSTTGVVVSAKYDAENAARLSLDQLRADPVFSPYPFSVTNDVITLLVRGAILAQGIPALTPATGAVGLFSILDQEEICNLNLPDNVNGILKPNGWPLRTRYTGRWLHSDMKDVAFFYAYRLYEKIIEKGNLK